MGIKSKILVAVVVLARGVNFFNVMKSKTPRESKDLCLKGIVNDIYRN